MAEAERARAAAPLVRPGLRAFLELDRFDVICVLTLVAASLLVRFASPILVDFLGHPLRGAPVRALGVGYPYNASGCTGVRSTTDGTPATHCGFVFDEVYFPVDAYQDLQQPPVSYFDPEPPLAKSLMVPPIALLGFNTWSWRLSTILAGSLFVGLVYLIARRLRRDRFFALAASLLVGLDGLALVESRTGVIDMIAICLVAMAYYAFLLHWQARTRTQWRVTLYVMAAALGLAMAAKLTALAPLALAMALITLRWLEPWLRRFGPLGRLSPAPSGEALLWREAGGRLAALHGLAAVVLLLAVFAASYSRYLSVEHHDVYRFSSCTLKGGLVAPQPAVMPAAVAHVAGLTVPDPVQAVRNIFEKTGADLQYHQTECRTHGYSSRWYSWPAMYHPVLFYVSDRAADAGSPPLVASITDMGNPVVWWLGIAGLLWCVWRSLSGPTGWRLGVAVLGVASLALMIILFHAAERPDTETVRVAPGALFSVAFLGVVLFAAAVAVSAVLGRRFVPALIVLAYLTAWLMWVPGNERRILFFYHALGMLPFCALALAYLLSWLRPRRIVTRWGSVPLAPLTSGVLAAAAAAFVFFYPVWTAAPLAAADHAMRIWVDTW